jgi:hypothetical protein
VKGSVLGLDLRGEDLLAEVVDVEEQLEDDVEVAGCVGRAVLLPMFLRPASALPFSRKSVRRS